MASPWLLADQQRRRAAQAEELARLTQPSGLAGQSFGYAHQNNPIPNEQSAYDRFVQENQVTPPARPPQQDPEDFTPRPDMGSAELYDLQRRKAQSELPPEKQQGAPIGALAGAAMGFAGEVAEPISGAVSLARGLLGDKKAMEAGKESLPLFFEPKQQTLNQPRPEQASELSMRESAGMLGEAFGGEKPLLERLGQIPNAIQRSAELWLGPSEVASAGKLITRPTNAMARKVHQAILSRAKGAGRGETLFSLGDLSSEAARKINTLRAKLPDASPEEYAKIKADIGMLRREAMAEGKAAGEARTMDVAAQNELERSRMGLDPVEKQVMEVRPLEDAAESLTRNTEKSRVNGKWKKLPKKVDPFSEEADAIMEGNSGYIQAQVNDYIARGMWKTEDMERVEGWVDDLVSHYSHVGDVDNEVVTKAQEALDRYRMAKAGRKRKMMSDKEQFDPFKDIEPEPVPSVAEEYSKAEYARREAEFAAQRAAREQAIEGQFEYRPEPVPREPAISPETQAEFKSAAEKAGNPEYADKVLAKAEEIAQGPEPLADDAADQAEKTYAMVASQHRPPATQAGTQIVPQAGGPVGPHVYSTFNTRGVPPGPGAPNPQLTGPKPKGWEPAFDPDQPSRNAAAGRYDVPPVGRFFEYAGIKAPELIPERTAIGKTNLLEAATAGKSEYASMPNRQRQVAAARLAKTDAAHRLQEMNNAEQVVASEILPGAIQTATDLHHNPRIERELTKATPLPGTDAYVTRWQLGTSKYKLATLTGEEKRVLDGLNQGVEKIGDYAERFKFALQTSDGKLIPFKKSGNWPQFTKPEHWKLMRDDPNYMEAYLKALTDANAHFGYNVTSQANQLRQSILETKNLAEMETAFEHARDIPVPIAAFKYDGSVREVTNFRLTGEGGYIENFTSKAPRHVAWNHYFGQNFNQVGEQAINEFKLLNPTAPTPRSVVDDFVRIFKEGGYLKDAKSFEALVHAMHGTKPEGWMNLLAPGWVKSAAQFATQNSVSRFLSNIFRFNVSRMTDEVFKYNLVQPFAQTKALGGASRLLKPETTIDTIKAWFTGGSRGKLSNRGLEMNPFERLPIETDEISNAYMKHGSNWKTADEIMNRVAMKRFTEEKSSRAMDLSSARYMQELEEMAKGGITRGRRDTLVHSVGMPQTWIDALERTAPMPKSLERDVMMKLLADAYETQFVKRSSHINQSPLFKTGIELWDKNILTAPFSIFAREPAQYFAHTIQSTRQIIDGLKKMNMSMFAEGVRRLSAQAVGLGITGGFVSFANNILQRARGLEPDEERSLIKSLTLLVAQGTMGKFADVLNPAIQQAINGKDAGDKLSAISWTSPHFQVGADYIAPVLNQLTNSDADLMHDMWKHIVTKYMPGRAITSFLGLGMAAWQATKADIQKATEKTRKAGTSPSPIRSMYGVEAAKPQDTPKEAPKEKPKSLRSMYSERPKSLREQYAKPKSLREQYQE